MHRYWSFPIAGAICLSLLSCKTEETKQTTAAPPVQAMAPSLPTVQPAPPRKIEEKVQPKVDPVDALIAKADKEYQVGLTNYTAGHLDAAKDNFDRAFDLLLASGQDIHGNERLQQEFDKLVEGVNNLELVALKAGDGFTEQKSEPAPIDEANEVTFPVDPNVRARAEREIKDIHSDLPLVINDEVARYISYFSTHGRGTLEHALIRSGRYREMILRILRQEGVPQDLIYLAEAESGFHPLALSRAGARGMWQFMASRASGYGLQRNWWLDDRQDPEKSTHAAARHLKDLYNQFGDWYLAMAAYNSGPGTVQSAVQRTGYADFWQLYRRGVLPKETRNYVPIILAVAIMAKNPTQYGLDHLEAEPPLRADRVEINYPVDLRLVAECVDTSVATLQELNPSLLRMTTPKDGTFSLRLPAGTASKYQQTIAAIPKDMRVAWRYHKVNRGETLADIARQYHTTSNAIAQVNNLRAGEVGADSKLIIPVAPGRHAAGSGGEFAYAKRPTLYKARKGDTVLSIADDFGVPAEKIRKWNRIHGNQVRAGQTLRVYRPIASGAEANRETAGGKTPKLKNVSSLQASNGRLRHHTVKPGETLFSIANRYNTSVAALRRDNKVSGLKAGDVLVIRTP
ncbi:MAG: LysM peptidoglycan-binding domain-containing protein [Terriglobales bacterium]